MVSRLGSASEKALGSASELESVKVLASGSGLASGLAMETEMA
jgi:hypothetical protein